MLKGSEEEVSSLGLNPSCVRTCSSGDRCLEQGAFFLPLLVFCSVTYLQESDATTSMTHIRGLDCLWNLFAPKIEVKKKKITLMWHLMFFFMRSKQVTTSGAGKKKKNSTEALKCHKLHFLCFLHFKAALKSEFIPYKQTSILNCPTLKHLKTCLHPGTKTVAVSMDSLPLQRAIYLFIYI